MCVLCVSKSKVAAERINKVKSIDQSAELADNLQGLLKTFHHRHAVADHWELLIYY